MQYHLSVHQPVEKTLIGYGYKNISHRSKKLAAKEREMKGEEKDNISDS